MDLLHRVRTWLKSALRAVGLDVRRIRDFENRVLFSVPGGLRRIHYGCGTLAFDGWLNVDLFPPAGTDRAPTLRVNLVRKHPFPDDWFEFGYSEDLLEHLDQADQMVFLTEAFRTLRPGGTVRLYVPILDEVLVHHYSPCVYATAIEAKGSCYDLHGHRSFPSRADLELMARCIGFSKVLFSRPGESTHPALVGLEHRVEQAMVHGVIELVK
jgi:predicted SAM-dependent methyltransferase